MIQQNTSRDFFSELAGLSSVGVNAPQYIVCGLAVIGFSVLFSVCLNKMWNKEISHAFPRNALDQYLDAIRQQHAQRTVMLGNVNAETDAISDELTRLSLPTVGSFESDDEEDELERLRDEVESMRSLLFMAGRLVKFMPAFYKNTYSPFAQLKDPVNATPEEIQQVLAARRKQFMAATYAYRFIRRDFQSMGALPELFQTECDANQQVRVR